MSPFANRFVTICGLLTGLWFLFSPSQVFADPFPADGKPHFCKNSAADHIDYPPPTAPGGYEQMPTGASYTWTICRLNSNATEWYLVIKNGATPVCQIPYNDPNTPQIETIPALLTASYPCNTPGIGVYTASVNWKVPGGSVFMSHTDYFYKVAR